MAQRLVRLTCPHCRVAVPLETACEELLAARPEKLPEHQFVGQGCQECAQTGYQGRTGIYELLPVDEAIRQLILARADAVALRQTAVSRGMQTLAEDGWAKVAQGLTTCQEVLRVTQE